MFLFKVIVMVIGGCEVVYCNIINLLVVMGDGIVMVYCVKGVVKDMEFI